MTEQAKASQSDALATRLPLHMWYHFKLQVTSEAYVADDTFTAAPVIISHFHTDRSSWDPPEQGGISFILVLIWKKDKKKHEK